MPADVVGRVHYMSENRSLSPLVFGDQENEESLIEDMEHDNHSESPSASDTDASTSDDSDGDDGRNVREDDVRGAHNDEHAVHEGDAQVCDGRMLVKREENEEWTLSDEPSAEPDDDEGADDQLNDDS